LSASWRLGFQRLESCFNQTFFEENRAKFHVIQGFFEVLC
jgi:hypothetical protein